MKVNILKLIASDFPDFLSVIQPPPRQLFVAGVSPKELAGIPKVAVVGSRKASAYGIGVTDKIVFELAEAGVAIISGLALGIDSVAHRASLRADGLTVAVLPTALEHIYPASNNGLARSILDQGGALISEYSVDDPVYKANFRDRNRIISGLADIILVTEAAIDSGSLVTARFGLEQGKTVMAVPGNITSAGSEGCNNLIKSGAIPVTTADDVFFALGFKRQKRRSRQFRGTPDEEKIFNLIREGVNDQEELATRANLSGAEAGSIITTLELGGYIKPAGSGRWLLA